MTRVAAQSGRQHLVSSSWLTNRTQPRQLKSTPTAQSHRRATALGTTAPVAEPQARAAATRPHRQSQSCRARATEPREPHSPYSARHCTPCASATHRTLGGVGGRRLRLLLGGGHLSRSLCLSGWLLSLLRRCWGHGLLLHGRSGGGRPAPATAQQFQCKVKGEEHFGNQANSHGPASASAAGGGGAGGGGGPCGCPG